VLDYGRGGPYSWTTSEEVSRGRTTSGQVRGSIVYPGSMVKVIVCVVWMCVVYNASMIP